MKLCSTFNPRPQFLETTESAFSGVMDTKNNKCYFLQILTIIIKMKKTMSI